MKASERNRDRDLLADIENPNTSLLTLQVWLNAEENRIARAEESMRKAQSMKALSVRRVRRIKSAIKRRGENV
jgi:hypothetical protein